MIIVDVETTGLNENRHSIFGIGAIDFENPSYVFNLEFRPFEGCKYDMKSLDYNGYTIKEIENFNVSFEEGMNRFYEWVLKVKDRTIAGQNVHFDLGFINNSFRRINKDFKLPFRIVDLHSLAYAKLKSLNMKFDIRNNESKINSSYIAEFVGIPPEDSKHTPIGGAKWEAESFSRIIYGRNLLEEYSEYSVPKYL